MANAQTNAAVAGGNIFTSFFETIIGGIAAISEANSRVHEVDRLNALSDEQLAKMGLKRTDIVRHVFRDCMYV